jgi:recombination protein RecT
MSNAVAQVAQTATQSKSLVSLVNDMGPQIQRALPRHMSGDRIARLAVTALRQNRALAQCKPESFIGAILTAATLGLEPNTPAGEAYLIPYGKECTLVIGYQGLTKLYWQSPLAQHLDTQAVHEHDRFTWRLGLDPVLEHEPATGDRGKVTHYYAVARLTNGATPFVVLTADEVKRLRGGKVGTQGVADPMHWMERKTALRQLLKLLPKSAEVSRAIESDERGGADLYRSMRAEAQEPAEEEAIDGEIVDA